VQWEAFSFLIFLVLFAPDSYREAKTNKEKRSEMQLAIKLHTIIDSLSKKCVS